MTVRLYDSRAQAVVDFEPIVEGRVGMYVCGPTVQSSPHIGHLRSALVYDLWRRWLTYRGYDVTFVRNVTDIDDKILASAAVSAAFAASPLWREQLLPPVVSADDGGSNDSIRSGPNPPLHPGADPSAAGAEQWWALAYRVELEFTAGYAALGILPPTYEPRATASIAEMQAVIGALIARGHAYAADDSSGDVYFDTASWPGYGELTRQRADDMVAADDIISRAKRDGRDFALWKGRKPGEPESAAWESPWGAGRPGWHIECSAMSRRYLGPRFDIHGGGLDLRFPHHENELAQSTAAGDPFASYWVHNGLVTVGGQKMSKSLGNSIFAATLLDVADPIVVRYFLSAAHYRSTIDYHEGSLEEAHAAFDRIESFLARSERRLSSPEALASAGAASGTVPIPDAFAAAMDDDLAVPQALAVLHDTIRAGNVALDADDTAALGRLRADVVSMVEVLGIDPASPQWVADSAPAHAEQILDALVAARIEARDAARAARDFATADSIRDELSAAGILLEDGQTGTRWTT